MSIKWIILPESVNTVPSEEEKLLLTISCIKIKYTGTSLGRQLHSFPSFCRPILCLRNFLRSFGDDGTNPLFAIPFTRNITMRKFSICCLHGGKRHTETKTLLFICCSSHISTELQSIHQRYPQNWSLVYRTFDIGRYFHFFGKHSDRHNIIILNWSWLNTNYVTLNSSFSFSLCYHPNGFAISSSIFITHLNVTWIFPCSWQTPSHHRFAQNWHSFRTEFLFYSFIASHNSLKLFPHKEPPQSSNILFSHPIPELTNKTLLCPPLSHIRTLI